QRIEALPRATRSTTDEQLLRSWLDSLTSPHTRRNFETTARRLLAALPQGMRTATIEDLRDALRDVTAGMADSSARQCTLRVKSLFTYAHKLGYTLFNAGAAIKVKNSTGSNRGAELAKRIITAVEVSRMIQAATNERDCVLLEVLYAGGLRV